MKLKFSIIGIGKVGSALTLGLNDAGYDVSSITGHDVNTLKKISKKTGSEYGSKINDQVLRNSDVIFICVQDSKLNLIIESLSAYKKVLKGKYLVHTSGALSSEIFKGLVNKSNAGSFHPVQTFSRLSLKDGSLLNSITFGIEGGRNCIALLNRLARDFNSETIEIKANDKILYHIACVVASNFLVCYVDIINDILEKIGKQSTGAFRIFEPIISETLKNLKLQGTAGSLTGPVSRGDLNTVRNHLAELTSKDFKTFYKVLSKKAADITFKRGKIDKNTYDSFLKLFSETK